MPSARDCLDHVGHARIERSLRQARVQALTGTVRVSGRPGGLLRVRGGRVVAAVSPGAPGVRALLVRTGRVGDEDWAWVGGAIDQDAAGVIGAAHLHVIEVMATQDALFAMLAGTIDGCWFEPGPAAPEGTGDEPAELLRIALRKLAALAALDRAVLPHHERLARSFALPAGGGDHAEPGSGPAAGDPGSIRESILRYADGRRTARDIAFLCGRSLYAVTVEMSRMLGEGILHEPLRSPDIEPGAGLSVQLLPRSAAPPKHDDGPPSERPELPRRRPAASGLTADMTEPKTPAFWKEFLRFGGRAGESRT